MVVLKIENLKFQRSSATGNNFCLHIDNILVNEGSKIALLGLNGSGKSTLLQILAGIYGYKGELFVLGEKHSQIKKNLLGKKISLNFQNPDHNLIASTVREELLFASRNFFPEQSEEIILQNTLSQFPIKHLLEKAPYDLSYGEKKLVSLAVSMAHHPDILLLDEPFSMLDIIQKINLAEFIKSLKIKLVIIATHELDQIKKICDYILILNQGIVQKFGPLSKELNLIEELSVKDLSLVSKF